MRMYPANLVRRAAACYASHTAVWFEGREQSYAALYQRASRLAGALRTAGASPGDAVAILSDNAFETLEQASACALGNFARTTLFTYNAPAVNRYLLALTGARVLIVQARHHAAIAPLLSGLEQLAAVIVFDGEAAPGTLAYEHEIALADPHDTMEPVDPDAVHMIRFSSGTTGRPKGIFHSNARWMEYNDEWRWCTPPLTERSRYLSTTSLSHLGIAFIWGVVASGGCIVPMRAFDARMALDLLASQRITHAVAAPVMIRDMVKEASQRSHAPRFPGLQCMVYAGSPIAEDTLHGAIELFGSCLYQMYGQSEVAPVTMLLPHQHVINGTEAEKRRMRSVGRATPKCRVTIRDEQGLALPVGAIGEIAADGPPMSGIWNDPEATAARFLPDGSILTRDMGYMDEDGFVYLVDRKDDMIVSGGYNLWPTEIEEAIASHPAVAEVCVFGVPHPRWGESPHAVVVLRAAAQVSAEELIAHCRAIVGGVKKVGSVEFAEDLPRTTTGKVLRHALKEPHWAGRATRVSGS